MKKLLKIHNLTNLNCLTRIKFSMFFFYSNVWCKLWKTITSSKWNGDLISSSHLLADTTYITYFSWYSDIGTWNWTLDNFHTLLAKLFVQEKGYEKLSNYSLSILNNIWMYINIFYKLFLESKDSAKQVLLVNRQCQPIWFCNFRIRCTEGSHIFIQAFILFSVSYFLLSVRKWCRRKDFSDCILTF